MAYSVGMGDVSQRQDTGILIAIEGIDGAGKTTQWGMLRDALLAVGEAPVTSKEPTNGMWGQKIRDSAANGRMSLEDELHAFIQDRSEHVHKVIDPALRAGSIVILDRYFYSTIAYQGSRGADVSELRVEMSERFPVPDMVFLLDIDPTLGLFRISHSRGETPNQFENAEQLAKAREIFEALARTDTTISVLDGSLSEAAVHAELLQRFVDGPLKQKRCAKDYGCDDPLHCIPALTGNCEWWRISRLLLAGLSETPVAASSS